MKYKIASVLFGLVYLSLASPIAKIEEQIWKNLQESELTNVLITFKKADTKSAWNRFYSLRLISREAILETQFSVGSIASTNTLSTFSSVGPGPNDAIKPDIAAPGTSVASASHLSDTGLRTLSGTSHAAPHVAGALALVFQARGGTVLAAHNRITSTALAHSSGDRICGGVSENTRPNNHVGHGRLDANAAA